ncbi:HNH endonuclease signature motif containing protein [Rhodococcus sp. H36-A4]|uniref:HNH endonuclease n=1 Tax=Rhodococcus sp. H36-A4 TaxID=3004353 RepID=UPI0022AE8789|nr:HNH endonuclease signature motif containing protein [Rhodococcus sp. H36-A4]MCZ4076563.1 HNH endonuclease signature motif containing protein [Rhodococcus sp. H36-A4]
MQVSEVMEFVARLNELKPVPDAATGIDLITALETATCACAAAQAVATDAVAVSISEQRKALGKPKAQWRAGLASQIGLARRVSPNKGATFLGLARSLVHEMPHTLDRLRGGELNEYRAILIARETACLTFEDRQVIDRRLCADGHILNGLGDDAIAARARAMAAELDPASVVKRFEKAFSARRTSTRPQPDFMCQFTTVTSMDRAVCMWATLRRDADSIINAGGESRTRDQIMADLAYERITGTTSAGAGAPVSVNLVIADTTLLADSTVPAHLQGYGEIPAVIARKLVGTACADTTRVELRRVYATPSTGALTSMESKARIFPAALARLIDLRDRTCRTPWCDAPIRHHDHIRSYARGGDTSANNGAGLCAACNHAKEADGWSAEPRKARKPGVIHIYDMTTPTGHKYSPTAPPMPVVISYPSFIEQELVIDLSAA